MTSFLVCHKEVNRFSPSRNPAEEAPLAGLKEEGRLLPRPWITRTKPSRLGLAQGGGVVRRGWLGVFSTLAIGFVCLAAPLRAQFAYVANLTSNTVSAYSIGANGALTPVPGSPFATFAPTSVAVDPKGKFAYAANSGDGNVSAYSIGANGALTPVPGSPFAAGSAPFSVATTPLVPFASSFAKLEIAKHRFDLKESFTLGANSNGINPVTENVTLEIGTFSVTIPAGSFEQKPNGRFDFKGVINDVKLKGKGGDLTGLTNPVTVVLTIGTLVGSNSSSGVSMRPVKHLYFDECDRFSHEVATKEGHAIDLARIRQTTFGDGKILLVSSPTIAGQSRIEAAFLDSTQEHWYLPCPGCGTSQRIVWPHLDHESARLRCEGCHELFGQAAWLRGNGVWKAHAPGPRVRGFHISGLLSSFLPWREMVDEFRAASQLSQEGDHGRLKVFVNTRLAEPWVAPSVQLDESDILSRREYYPVELPEGVLVLLASIDTQDTSLEYLVAGIGRRRELWFLERASIPGDLAKDALAMYAEVDSRILNRIWRFTDHKGLKTRRVVQDSGGHHAGVINTEARKRPRTMITYRGGPSKVSGALYRVNRLTQERVSMLYGASDLGKDLVFSRLKVLQPGPGYIHIPFDSDWHHGFGEGFADELTAERKELTWRAGERHVRWKLKGSHRHNESLDLAVMLLLLAESMALKDNMQPDYCLEQEKAPKPVYGVVNQPLTEMSWGSEGPLPASQNPRANPQPSRERRASPWGAQNQPIGW